MSISVVPFEDLPVLDLDLSSEHVVPQNHPVWLDVLKRVGEDCHGLAALEDGRPVGWLFYSSSEAHGVRLVSSLPYLAYGGPATPLPRPDVQTELLRYLRRLAEELGADVVAVATPAFLPEPDEARWREALAPTHEHRNPVQIQSLVPHPLDQSTGRRRSTLRQQLNRARRGGLVVSRTMDPATVEEWLTIYNTRYAEIGARPYPDEFHRAVYEIAVPRGAAEFWAAHLGDELVGGVIFLRAGRTVDYFSSAFRSEHRSSFPTTLLLSEAFAYFGAQGMTRFNWQSSPNGGGVFEFKARWGATEHRHFYLSALLRPDTGVFGLATEQVSESFPFRFVLPFSAWPANSEPALGGPTVSEDP